MNLASCCRRLSPIINYEETWSLDETGNWREYQQDTDGDGTWNLIQSRTSNKVNEITDITETAGNSWTTPVYNKSGNMTTIPTPDDPTVSYTATYDAWNRLVKLEDDTNTITEYQYDGTRRRIIHKVYNTGALSHTKHLYYNNNWQLLEERRDTNTTPTKQFIWGNRYIDDLVLRDHDTDDNGTLNERLYALQDANWNVTSYVNENGTVQERYIYNAYGDVTFLDNNFGVISNSTIEPDHLYAGYNYDADVEVYHVRNRVYHAELGTWLQRDPIGYDGGINLYEYVHSLVTSNLDPKGLAWWGRGRKDHRSARKQLKDRLLNMCDDCIRECHSICARVCKREAERIANGFFWTLEMNMTPIRQHPFGDGYQGIWCWDWAAGFEKLIKDSSPTDCYKSELGAAFSGDRLHYWVKIISPCSRINNLYIDDSYTNKWFVHFVTPAPSGWTVVERVNYIGLELNPVEIHYSAPISAPINDVPDFPIGCP